MGPCGLAPPQSPVGIGEAARCFGVQILAVRFEAQGCMPGRWRVASGSRCLLWGSASNYLSPPPTALACTRDAVALRPASAGAGGIAACRPRGEWCWTGAQADNRPEQVTANAFCKDFQASYRLWDTVGRTSGSRVLGAWRTLRSVTQKHAS